MTGYLIPIKTAMVLFPFIAFLITLPYILYQYRKFGAIPFLRTLIIYSFVLYLMTIYFLVILPLPSRETLAKLPIYHAQWIPFQFIVDIIKEVQTSSGVLDLFKRPSIYTVLFNLVMFVPFGIYMRYYFKCSWGKTLLLSFFLSLFFELTQLTGLYFIYPRSYRLFDVDDLMINTLGGMIGFWISPLVSKLLPSKERLDETSYARGKEISFLRRLIAFLCDLCFSTFLTVVLSIAFSETKFFPFLRYSSLVFFFVIVPILWKGKTFGKMIVKMKMVNLDEKEASWYQYFIKYIFLFLLLVGNYQILSLLFDWFLTAYWYYQVLLGVTITLLLVLELLFYCQIIRSMFSKRHFLIYEKVSHLKNQSTIKIPSKVKIVTEEETCYTEEDRGETNEKGRARSRSDSKSQKKKGNQEAK